jgi:hypothetical protein
MYSRAVWGEQPSSFSANSLVIGCDVELAPSSNLTLDSQQTVGAASINQNLAQTIAGVPLG